MICDIQTIKDRREFAVDRIGQLEKAIAGNPDIVADTCIYATGSYGRFEASRYSDLDLFFVRQGSEKKNAISVVEKSLTDAAVVKACRKLKFPEFTKGGIYLQVHYLDDILNLLGGHEDDYRNLFTARMLLLLESVSIFNEGIYNKAIGEIIDSYFRDYHDHEKDFLPIFLVNDIQRFWRTLCLNFEHRRNRGGDISDYQKNRSHLANFKLKFSRLLICYSMIISIMAIKGAIDPQKILEVVEQTPLQRLDSLDRSSDDLSQRIDEIGQHYAWFLEMTGREEKEVLEWIGDRKTRDEAFTRARNFGNLIHLLLRAVANSEQLRYLII